MRILLINVCIRFDSPIKYIPVGLSCIATALTRVGFKPDILDIDLYRYSEEEVNKFLEKDYYDVIGLGHIISGYKYIKRLCIQVKKAMPTTTLIVGNTVASSIPNLLLKWIPEIDIAVIGEGDQTVVDIVKAKIEKNDIGNVAGIAYRNGGKVVLTTRRKEIPNLEKLPFPDYSLFDIDNYLELSNIGVGEPHPIPKNQIKAIPINTARGCAFRCTFCNHAFKGYKYRYYPFEMVVNRFKSLQESYGVNYLLFWDELSLISIRRTEELCNAIEKAKINFYWNIGPRGNLFTKKDIDLLKRCKDLGALSMGGALESADPEILKAMNKRVSIEQFIEQMETAREAGLAPRTSLVFGYPQETAQTIKKTIDVCRRLGIYPSVGFLLPLPQTPVYQYAREKGYIVDEEEYLLRIGDRQDLHINLTQMDNDLFINTLREELIKLKNELDIQISDDQVIKTGVERAPANNSKNKDF